MRLPEPPISVCKSEKKGSVAVQLVTDLALDARVTAIRRATNYIYIEASLMSLVPAVFRALQDTLPTIQRLIIVTPTLAPWAVAAGFEKYRYDLLAPLYAAFPSKMSVYTLRATPLHSNVLLIDDVFVAIGATDWTFRRPTRSPLNVHLVDAATTIADDGVRVTHFARMFRLARFAALTGGVMSFNMSFLDAADALQTYAATHIFGVIVPAPPVYKYYFARYNDATQAAFEGHAPCQRSDDALVSIACVCRGVALDRCPELLAYADGPGALVEAQMDAAQLHTAITVLGGMLVATLVLLCVLVTCCRRWLRRRHNRRRITAILNEALRPHQRLPST
ncbi:hypothetical protein SDRG_13821 [Saprolegnia diclina VS20]|uniref:PLD phosphodiesterase domain-containing protein n=1 Tax=Saprolegnia diclina (strain VS20) TaxID=1156394 RepID=T0R8U0_SAPDV|nr:hypothetical protein SDRG_13821 [Saprolegnia diclina VS20]EQC28493.1 hypothetical protein SDRG_13821 [Saprolegnia diclina VS20]|eukprot:XP_008618141.1 hypothetical protein SDRG_13821 [Saprolegnia diclina VS20]